MFCKYCGSKMPENAKFCQSCGGQTESNLNPQMNSNIPVNNPVVNNNIPNQPVNNMAMNNTPMTTNSSKNTNTILLVILIIIGLCAIAVPIVLTVINNSEDVEEKDDTNIKTEEKEEEPEIEYPANTTEVRYSGYTFEIPNEYTYMEYEGNLAVMPSDSSWIIMFVFSDGEFDDLKTQLPILDASLAEQFKNANSEYKTYQGQEYILTDFISDGEAMQMILTDAGNGKILMSLLMPVDTSVTFSELFYIAFPIVTSVE